MSAFTPDFVGFSGNRLLGNIPSASITKATIVQKIVDTLTAVGWTILSGPTPVSFGDEYELYSAQSPWYDVANVPSWYIGGRAYMKIIYPNSTAISFLFGEYYNSVPTDVMTLTNLSLTVAAFNAGPYNFYILGNPYECWIWSSNTGAEGNSQIYLGALNVPKPILQKEKVISVIVGGRLRTTASELVIAGTSYWGFRTKDQVSTQNYTHNNTSANGAFLRLYGGGTGDQEQTGRRLWSTVNDPLATNPNLWNMFCYPAQLAFPVGSASSDFTFNGFMWDSFILSEGIERNSLINKSDRVWMAYAGPINVGNGSPGTLFLNIGPTGTVLP